MSAECTKRFTVSEDDNEEEESEDLSPTEASEEKEAKNRSKQKENQRKKTKTVMPKVRMLQSTTKIFVNDIPRDAVQKELIKTFSNFGRILFVYFLDL